MTVGEPVGDEARLRIEGGIAHFPGRARAQRLPFDRLTVRDREEIARLAEEAGFFACHPAPAAARPDARTYTVGLTIGGRSRDVRLAEPIADAALATLVATLRRLARQLAAPPVR